MDALVEQRLRQQGQLRPLSSGREGLPASLMWEPDLRAASWPERRRELQDALGRVVEGLVKQAPDSTVDWESLSVSSQTVEAWLPVEAYDELTEELEQAGVRVDPLVEEQVV